MIRKLGLLCLTVVLGIGIVFLFSVGVMPVQGQAPPPTSAQFLSPNQQPEFLPISAPIEQADLEITKRVTPTLAPALGYITYTLAFTNHGPGLAENVVISDTFHPQLGSMLTWSSIPVDWFWGPYIQWRNFDLAPGATGVITVQFLVLSNPKSVFPVTNTVSITSDTPDSNTTNNQAAVYHTLDTDPPKGANPLAPGFGVRVTDPWVTFAWTETVSADFEGYLVYYRVDFDKEYAYDAGKALSATVLVPDGLVDWMVLPYDAAGNLGKDGEDSIFIHDSTPPEVIGAIPAAGAENVSLDQTIVITFSEFVNSNTALIIIMPDPENVLKTWAPDAKSVSIAHEYFETSTKYTVSVWAEDRGGLPINPVGSSWTFTTQHYLFLPLIQR